MNTVYLVLRVSPVATDEDSVYVRLGDVMASSADQAIRLMVNGLDEAERGGDYVATPARSWTRRTVEPVVQTRLKLT